MIFRENPISHNVNIYTAYDRWLEFHHEVSSWVEVYKPSFGEFLGGYDGSLGVLGSWLVSEEGINRMKMLLGPHGKTIVKAYKAKRRKS